MNKCVILNEYPVSGLSLQTVTSLRVLFAVLDEKRDELLARSFYVLPT